MESFDLITIICLVLAVEEDTGADELFMDFDSTLRYSRMRESEHGRRLAAIFAADVVG